MHVIFFARRVSGGWAKFRQASSTYQKDGLSINYGYKTVLKVCGFRIHRVGSMGYIMVSWAVYVLVEECRVVAIILLHAGGTKNTIRERE